MAGSDAPPAVAQVCHCHSLKGGFYGDRHSSSWFNAPRSLSAAPVSAFVRPEALTGYRASLHDLTPGCAWLAGIGFDVRHQLRRCGRRESEKKNEYLTFESSPASNRLLGLPPLRLAPSLSGVGSRGDLGQDAGDPRCADGPGGCWWPSVLDRRRRKMRPSTCPSVSGGGASTRPYSDCAHVAARPRLDM